MKPGKKLSCTPQLFASILCARGQFLAGHLHPGGDVRRDALKNFFFLKTLDRLQKLC